MHGQARKPFKYSNPIKINSFMHGEIKKMIRAYVNTPATIEELNNIVKTTHIFIEAHRQLCESDTNNQPPILDNFFLVLVA